MRRLLLALLALGVLAPVAAAQEPARWRGVGVSQIPLTYFQGMASDPDGRVFFDGFVVGLHRTDDRLRERAFVDDVMPPAVRAQEGYNHVGDIAWDARAGGRVLLPLECYSPNAQPDPNTCHTGAIGVADPVTLRWRYYVKLSPAEIPKAMWAEVSPDGRLLWTSAGADLLAYRMADVRRPRAAPAGAPLHAVRRLPGAVPPTGVTGAAFYGDRLLLAGQQDIDFEVWSVDVATGTRRLEIRRGVVGESEGLDVLHAFGGLLHWIVTPFDPLHRTPTYGSSANALLHFRPVGRRPALRLAVRPATIAGGRRITLRARVRGRGHPIAGAVVRASGRWALTSASGVARLVVPARPPGRLAVTAARDDLRSGRVVVRVGPLSGVRSVRGPSRDAARAP